jgi:membrane protein implicated in regulation of membrane protease activity
MIEIVIVVAFIIWYVLAMVISERIGKTRKIGVEWSFFISFMLSPLVGWLITKFSPKIEGV